MKQNQLAIKIGVNCLFNFASTHAIFINLVNFTVKWPIFFCQSWPLYRHLWLKIKLEATWGASCSALLVLSSFLSGSVMLQQTPLIVRRVFN